MSHKLFHHGQPIENKYNGDKGLIASKPDVSVTGKVTYVVFWDDHGPRDVDGDDLQTRSERGKRDKHAITAERLKPENNI